MTTSAPPKVEKSPVEKTAFQNAPNEEPRLVKWAVFFGKVIAWQLVALLIVEIILAMAGLGEEEIFKLDPKYGFVHMTDKRVTWRSEGFARSYFGPDGMREADLTIQKPAGVFRVALLGDSLVESLQVPIEETFGKELERKFKKSASGKELQVLNFGNSGYSTAQEFMQLKDKVMKYSPDAVIVFYNHRDIFENWAPPDQTITNVRPYALHLPNQPLTIDSSSVAAWMKSPRGKFLTSISWIRKHSRIWGMIAAWETQASFHDPVYRAVIGFFTAPDKTITAAVESLSKVTPKSILDAAVQSFTGKKEASFNIKFIDEQPDKSPKKADGKNAEQNEGKLEKIDPAKVSSLQTVPSLKDFPKPEEDAKIAEAKAAEQKARDTYFNLMFKTLKSLFAEMNTECTKHGAKFAIAITPSKLALVETTQSIGLMDMSYDKQIEAVREYCQQAKIPYADMQADLEKMPIKAASNYFYSAHLTPQGHEYIAKEAQELFKTLIDDKEKSPE